jgi:hypothetical protein
VPGKSDNRTNANKGEGQCSPMQDSSEERGMDPKTGIVALNEAEFLKFIQEKICP